MKKETKQVKNGKTKHEFSIALDKDSKSGIIWLGADVYYTVENEVKSKSA